MLNNLVHLAELNSSYQKIRARVELYKGSTLEKICNCGDLLSGFTVEKTGEGSYFGFGICQKLSASLIDVERELNITKEHTIEASFGVNSNFVYPFPNFYVYEVNRDESSNLVTVTAYDALYEATNHTVEELELPVGYSVRTFAAACARLLGIPLVIDAAADEAFDLMYEGGANFDGSESIRTALNRIAEATQTIYFMDSHWNLYFKRLDRTGEPIHKIGRKDAIDFQNEGELVLKSITHTTELGDSVSTVVSESAIETGVSQFIRDNPFLELREDIGELLDKAQAIVGGTVITQFELNWLGNYLLEIGDKIGIEKEDGAYTISYVMDDTVVFDGTLSQITKWKYDDNSSETANNPTTLGEALNKTFAKVDKVNKRIDLVVSDVEGQEGRVAQLELTTEGLVTTVSNVEEDVSTAIDDITGLKTTTTTHTEQIGTLQVSSESIAARVQKVEKEVEAFEELETGQFIEKVAELEIELDGIASRVSATETVVTSHADAITTAYDLALNAATGTSALEERVTTAETEIDQNAEAIELRATKSEVETVNGQVEANTSAISALQINTDSISASVKEVEEAVSERLQSVDDSIATLTRQASLTLTRDDVSIAIESELSNGVDVIKTKKGFTFDNNGLSIHEENSDISTQITEEGMSVYDNTKEVLTATKDGVNATNLKATTYLVIGRYCRIEGQTDSKRVGCFWID